jgi:hypothetical protein
MLNSKIPVASVTPHSVIGDWPEGSRLFFFNPASGAVEVRIEARAKVARSLNRSARKMKRSVLLLQLRLQIEYFALQVRCSALKLIRFFLRDPGKTFGYPHKTLPKGGNDAD